MLTFPRFQQKWHQKGEFTIPPKNNITRQAPPVKDGPRTNRDIRARTIRLIDDNGEMIGIVGLSEGLRMASEAGLDLVEVSPNAEPPVCKILDSGRYKYELQKRANEAKKKQKVIEIKEIKFRPNIGDHDYEIKLKQIRSFLEEGHKVKMTLRFRGREVSHQEIGLQLLNRAQENIADVAKVEQLPRMEGRMMVMMVSPK